MVVWGHENQGSFRVGLDWLGFTKSATFSELCPCLLEVKRNGSRIAFSCPVAIVPDARHLAVPEQADTPGGCREELRVLCSSDASEKC